MVVLGPICEIENAKCGRQRKMKEGKTQNEKKKSRICVREKYYFVDVVIVERGRRLECLVK